MNPLFIRGPSANLRLFILVIVSITLMVLDERQQYMQPVRATLTVATYPVRYLIDLPSSTGNWLSETFTSRRHLMLENEALHQEHLEFKAREQKLAALEVENARLRALLGSTAKVQEHTIIAELVALDMSPFSRQIVLNKGGLHGIYEGQAMIDAQGIMGQIIHVSPLQSTAILITDPKHTLPVEVNRNGLRSIASGTGESNRLILDQLPNNADILQGDLLVTSGLGGRFPAGYPVARVTEVIRNHDLPFAHVSAEPLAAIESSREVLLIARPNRPATESKASPPEKSGEK